MLFYLDRIPSFDRVGPILNELQVQHGLLFDAGKACTSLNEIPAAIYTSSIHNVIVQDITISFCCFQLLCSNTLCGFHYCVFIVWFLQFCFHYLVCHTLFPLFDFHTEQLAACRLFLRNKSGARCLASLALPSSVTRATTNVRFRKIRKHFVFLKKGGRCVSF